MMNVFRNLKQRKLLHQITHESLLLESKLKPGTAVYVGLDPTSESIHLGNYVNFIALHHYRLAGFQPIVLFGGATGLIGDPSGKSADRNLLSQESVDANISKFKA